MKTFKIRYAVELSPLLETLREVTDRVMGERRWTIPVYVGESDAADLELARAEGIPPEGFRIESGPGGLIRIVAGDDRGLFYGMGKFLRQCGMEHGEFAPGAWRGLSAPRLSMRGIYFATHFHNFYQEAPVEEVERYIEDLALLGTNALTVWFDMHHFTAIDDPKAAAMLTRLQALLKKARGAGMKAGLALLANEGYSTTPAGLRAVPTGRAHYGVEVCVATSKGEALVLENMRRELEAFKDTGLDFIWLWPYDQGGCACEACAPWGSNGMLKIGKKAALQFRGLYPKGKVIFSTWLFDAGGDQGEWEGLARAFEAKPDWVDYLMADSHSQFPRFPLDRGVPGGLPLLNFPEISMHGMLPWGAFGANPMPRRFERLWGQVAHVAEGGFPYSEGIFEDLNKAVYAHFYWTGQNDWREAVTEYAKFHFGNNDPAVILGVLDSLEQNHAPVWQSDAMVKTWGVLKGAVPVKDYPGWMRKPLAGTADVNRAEEAWALCGLAEADMPEWGKGSWRWRIVKLRAFLDRELLGNEGDPTPECEQAFRELEAIYHAEAGEWAVSPPVPGRKRE
jgi:hypothetical protein